VSKPAQTQRAARDRVGRQLAVALLGVAFGIIIVKSQVASWFRINAMFRFEEFHMYGVILSAIAVAMLSVRLIAALGVRTIDGEAVVIAAKPADHGQWIGGFIFGCGWALTGACPGPLYAQLGAVGPVVLITLFSALAGAWLYGRWRPHLLH